MTPRPMPAPDRQTGTVESKVGFVVLLAVLLGVVAGLVYATHEVYEAVTEGDGVAGLDHPAIRFMIAHRTPALTAVMVALTELGGRVGIPVLAGLALLLATIRTRDWTPTALLGAGMAGSLGITVVGKTVIGRVRPPMDLRLPPMETSPSFPSGHTLNATVLGAIVLYLVILVTRRGWRLWVAIAPCVLLPLAVGLSRVYLGQHWLTDVMAGWVVGLAWAGCVVIAHQVWLRLSGRPVRHVAR